MINKIKLFFTRIILFFKGSHFKRFGLQFTDYYELFTSMLNYFSLTKAIDRKEFMKFAKGVINIYGKPGHYYSPLETISFIEENKDKINNSSEAIHNINFNESAQLELLNQLEKFSKSIPFDNNNSDCLYYPDNNQFTRTDASILFSMIMHIKPKRIIEVGSGFSTALMVDTNKIYLNNSIDIQCIEPYPERLHSLLKDENTTNIQLQDTFVQNIDIDFFKQLDSNDILFIDSSHVSKLLSDLNYLIFQVIPVLRKNVVIHFHDIFYPFEYPLAWYREGRFYNEAYILRAFLQNNNDYQIILWLNYLTHKHAQRVNEILPLIKNDNSSGSIWIKKLD